MPVCMYIDVYVSASTGLMLMMMLLLFVVVAPVFFFLAGGQKVSDILFFVHRAHETKSKTKTKTMPPAMMMEYRPAV